MSSSSASAAASAALLGGCTSSTHSGVFLTSTPLYRVHPLVVFSILDHYQRRNDGQERVVGTLLGQQLEDGSIEVKQAFPVPHQEEQDAATVEIEYHHSMLALYKQVSPRDVVVGWYSTSGSNESGTAEGRDKGTPEQLHYITSLMHEVYRTLMPSGSSMEPLHLVVDVSMKGGMKVEGFVNQLIRTKQPAPAPASASAATPSISGLSLPAATVSVDVLANFQPVPVELFASEEEKIGVEALISGIPDDEERLDAPARFLTDAENIEQIMVKMLESIESIEAYIARVVEGKVAQPDTQLALQIHHLLASLPTLHPATFQTTFATHIQDLLAIVYLANMTKSQLAIADKANMLL